MVSIYYIRPKFQSYQFRQINPDKFSPVPDNQIEEGFNRINSGRSIPTIDKCVKGINLWKVSIVSIQADQSRRNVTPELRSVAYGFQSYQFRQINPDTNCKTKVYAIVVCFNRINSGRSIPTMVRKDQVDMEIHSVSIVSIQADQSRRGNNTYNKNCKIYSFNRINSGRSIPTCK